MNRLTPLSHHRPVVIRTASPLADWRFLLAGVTLLLGIYVLAAFLDEPAAEPEDPVVSYMRGVAEGRSQMQAAYGERSTLAYQRGLVDGGAHCAKGARP